MYVDSSLYKCTMYLNFLLQASKTTTAFLHQVLERVRSSSHLKMEARIAVLERARVDLNRLGSIEPSLSDPSAFAEIYIHGQSLMLKCLASKCALKSQTSHSQRESIFKLVDCQYRMSALKHLVIFLPLVDQRAILKPAFCFTFRRHFKGIQY